jgi:hypothetical protein
MLVPVGAILLGSATFFYGMVFFQHAWPGLTMWDLAIWLVVVGTATGALMGLVMTRLDAPSLRPRTRVFLLGLLGTICGLIPALVYGFGIEEVCVAGGIDLDCYGWPVLGWHVSSPWLALGLSAAVGVILGGVMAVVVGWCTSARRRSPTTSPAS